MRNDHSHGSDIIGQRVRELETKFVKAAATVGQTRKKNVNEELRRKVEQVSSELVSSISKSRAVAVKINREKRKDQGLPDSVMELMQKLPERYRTTSGGGEFLQTKYDCRTNDITSPISTISTHYVLHVYSGHVDFSSQ